MQGVLREWRCGPSSSGGNAADEPTPQQPNGRGRLRPLATRALLNNAAALPASRSRHQEPQMPALSPREFHHGLLGLKSGDLDGAGTRVKVHLGITLANLKSHLVALTMKQLDAV